MNILFFIVFLLFSVLILRLGIVQIVQGENYRKQVEQTDEISVSSAVPRGEIYDRNYEKIAYNTPRKAITYTPTINPQPKELLEVAKKLTELIDMGDDKEKVTTRELKDLWLLENNRGDEKVTEEEKRNLNDKEIYQLKLSRITEEDLKEVDLNLASIYWKLYRAPALTPSIVKNEGVTDEEYALVSEHLSDLPGVDITIDWEREKTYDKTFHLLGSVKNIPAEKANYYTSMGYKLNDRVGTSYLEEMLEQVLQGQKSVVKTVTDRSGNVVDTEILSEGKSGYDVVLTIDMELQAEVEKIIQEEILTMIEYPNTETFDSAFVVVMNPKTGEILTLAGKQYNREEKDFIDYSNGTFTYAFVPGSVVKGATVLMGYETGVISAGTVLRDEVMRFKGNVTISSVSTMGSITDLKALERSSNVYMAKIALAIAGGTYTPGGPLIIDTSQIDVMRKYFAQFGLGVETGIGFPNEATGIKGTVKATEPGSLLYYGFGQLDTYTPIQLAQYVSTIANGGYRMKPQLVKEIREPNTNSDELGPIVEEFKPVVLNRVDMKEEWIDRVKEGFWLVTHGSQGTARYYFANEPYDLAGKTGTAQTYDGKGRRTENLTFVGFAPYDDPEVAIAVVAPNAYFEGTRSRYSIANVISRRVLRTYFDLKEKRMKEDVEQSDTSTTEDEEINVTEED
ncbi:peptidoglycan D,D-transpeptidase FtsI family protein [Fervidibacillus halotolerans]|uniref:serine-type D-Ala-D-Ala carboxypeptidase n=1 Tax=Fervidibacillus halotolerans TaxID=2980027 RepID=A0A9E8M3W8_9BACI|nr:penicillin-binding protein 2 [Fervidibacillus halotolerans]WAA13929.1 penicillin-binding protein 2 [Fervidibacillus halotolerans]